MTRKILIKAGNVEAAADILEAPRPASPVNPLGRIISDASFFGAVPGGANISITRTT